MDTITFNHNGGSLTFYPRKVDSLPYQTLMIGTMDMGEYDEVALVSIEGDKVVAYVEDLVLSKENNDE